MGRFFLIEIGLLTVAGASSGVLALAPRVAIAVIGLIVTYALWTPLLRLAREIALIEQRIESSGDAFRQRDRESAFAPVPGTTLIRYLPVLALLAWFVLLFLSLGTWEVRVGG